MYSVSVEDVDRLLDATAANNLKQRAGDSLAARLANASQPPELGIASEDDFKRAMLRAVCRGVGLDVTWNGRTVLR